jgi:hypothetical protein
MLPTATPYRARNVGKTVGNKIFLKIFPFIFNSLESEFYSNSGSQKIKRLPGILPLPTNSNFAPWRQYRARPVGPDG